MLKAGNMVTVGLTAGCALLAALAALFASGWSNDINARAPAEPRPLAANDLASLPEFEMGDVDDYAEIASRPLFEPARRPKPKDTDEIVETVEPPVELDVAIGGIIITSGVKLALLTDNRSKAHMRVKEGANLEGDLADWVLTSIEPRKLSFDGGRGRQVELELEVNDRAITAPKPVASAARAQAEPAAEPASSEGADATDRAARAEEIRRRVAERRQELREEAQRRRAEREQEQDGDDDQ